jgi:hypothetical protein
LDVFVGIFWLRFGTPTPRAGSGTEEEFWIAHRAWKERDRAIQLMVYFCREPAPPPKDSAGAEQLAKVARFREALSREGLVRDYGAHAEFAAHVRRDLVLVLGQILHPASAPAAIAAQTAQLAPADDLGSARRALEALANEYDAVRDPVTGLPSGAERTRRMELIASRMRSLALSAYPLLDELQTSTSAGHRLAAVTILQAIPDVRQLDWLAGRLPAEKPFVGYHAAVALLVAARSLALADLPAVESALDLADARSRGLRIDADRATTLHEARSELHRRSATRPVN